MFRVRVVVEGCPLSRWLGRDGELVTMSKWLRSLHCELIARQAALMTVPVPGF